MENLARAENELNRAFVSYGRLPTNDFSYGNLRKRPRQHMFSGKSIMH